jgi:hypothetical protein
MQLCRVQNALRFEDWNQSAMNEAIRLYVGSQTLKRSVFIHGKAEATFEFIKRFCKCRSKTAILLMFISAVALFILPLLKLTIIKKNYIFCVVGPKNYVKILEME